MKLCLEPVSKEDLEGEKRLESYYHTQDCLQEMRAARGEDTDGTPLERDN